MLGYQPPRHLNLEVTMSHIITAMVLPYITAVPSQWNLQSSICCINPHPIYIKKPSGETWRLARRTPGPAGAWMTVVLCCLITAVRKNRAEKRSDSAGVGPSNLGWYLTAWFCIDLSDIHLIWTGWCPSLQSWNSTSFWAEFIITEFPRCNPGVQDKALGSCLASLGGSLQTECDGRSRHIERCCFSLWSYCPGWRAVTLHTISPGTCDTSLRNALQSAHCMNGMNFVCSHVSAHKHFHIIPPK